MSSCCVLCQDEDAFTTEGVADEALEQFGGLGLPGPGDGEDGDIDRIPTEKEQALQLLQQHQTGRMDQDDPDRTHHCEVSEGQGLHLDHSGWGV